MVYQSIRVYVMVANGGVVLQDVYRTNLLGVLVMFSFVSL